MGPKKHDDSHCRTRKARPTCTYVPTLGLKHKRSPWRRSKECTPVAAPHTHRLHRGASANTSTNTTCHHRLDGAGANMPEKRSRKSDHQGLPSHQARKNTCMFTLTARCLFHTATTQTLYAMVFVFPTMALAAKAKLCILFCFLNV